MGKMQKTDSPLCSEKEFLSHHADGILSANTLCKADTAGSLTHRKPALFRKKRYHPKRFRALMILLVFAVLYSCVGFTAMESDENITAQEIQGGELTFLDRPLALNQPLYYVAGRIFLPMETFVLQMGGNVSCAQNTFRLSCNGTEVLLNGMQDEKLTRPIYVFDDVAYLSLYDAAELFHLAVVFDAPQQKISLYHKKASSPVPADTEHAKKGLLRLEDIYFDNGVSGNFSNETNEKLRTVADYLYQHGQSFYIAWIPFYQYPALGIQNDMTKNFSFYNADFLYTLDYMVGHNGHIVLHGYTHQEKDTQSGVGTEFGANTPFSSKEIHQRMQMAKQMASALGFEDQIFEFPHYAFTEEQLRIAEKHFDVIYQQYTRVKEQGKPERIRKGGREILFLPTPLGYVPSVEQLPEILEKIDTLPEDQLRSLFFHPFMDFTKIHLTTTANGERTYTYDPDSVLVQLVDKITNSGYVFSDIEHLES